MSEDKIKAFVDATRASVETAKQYITTFNGNVEAAVAAYSGGQQSSGAVAPVPGPSNPPRSTGRSRGRIATFADLRRRTASESPERPGSDRLFTGGEKSALAVQNPGKGRVLVGDIITKARKAPPPGSASPEPARSYEGTGFRLGGESEPSAAIDNPYAPPVAAGHVYRTLTFWSDGFTIDDGELYRYDDPKNVEYLEAINSGRAPLELLGVAADQLVDVRIDQRIETPYTPPKHAQGFRGEGNRLGHALPHEIARASQQAAQSEQAAPAPAQAQDTAHGRPVVSGEGDAMVQIRLADGSAHRRRIDSQGTVAQLYSYVDQFADGRAYVLQLTFPNRPLDRDETVAEAGVKGATVVQRWT